jgi:hypothetical protein
MDAGPWDESGEGSTMTRVFALICILAAYASGYEGYAGLHQPLTLVVDAEKPLPPEAFAAMRMELDRLFSRTPIRLDLKDRKEIPLGKDVSDLVLFRFKGECRVRHEPVFLDERGPLAFTHVTDGSVLPFSEVLCERVRKAAKSSMFGGDHAKADRLMGRALARVVAHELFHILSGDCGHSHDGVFKKGLTGKQLIEENLDFVGHDIERLRLRSPGP